MSTQSPPPAPMAELRDPLYGELTVSWKWLLGLGILMAALGVIGLGLSYGLTILSVLWFGVLALIGGIAQLVDAFKCAGWRSVASHVLLGLLYVGAGVVLIAMPVQSAWWLTLLIAVTFIITGVLRAIMGFQMKEGGASWIWVVLSGLLSVVLGIMIFSIVELPTEQMLASAETAAAWFQEWGWVIGFFVALEFIIHGAAMIALALAARGRAGVGPGAGTGTPEPA